MGHDCSVCLKKPSQNAPLPSISETAGLDNVHSRHRTGPGVEDKLDTLRSPTSPLRHIKSPGSQTAKLLKSESPCDPFLPKSTSLTLNRRRLPSNPSARRSERRCTSKTSSYLSGKGPGAEPGIDVCESSAHLNYGHIRQNCMVEIADQASGVVLGG